MNDTATLPEEVEATVQDLLKLPPEQRVAIGERLFDSVGSDVNITDVDRAWIQVAAQRARDLREGRVQAVSIDDAVEKARKAVDAVRSSGAESDS